MITRPSHDLPNYKRGTIDDLKKFQSTLKRYASGTISSLFLPFGTQIGAGCGQFEFIPQNLLQDHKDQAAMK